jgi:hypothetical protein
MTCLRGWHCALNGDAFLSVATSVAVVDFGFAIEETILVAVALNIVQRKKFKTKLPMIVFAKIDIIVVTEGPIRITQRAASDVSVYFALTVVVVPIVVAHGTPAVS